MTPPASSPVVVVTEADREAAIDLGRRMLADWPRTGALDVISETIARIRTEAERAGERRALEACQEVSMCLEYHHAATQTVIDAAAKKLGLSR